MNCSVEKCDQAATVTAPLPLCHLDALRVMTSFAQAHLADAEEEQQGPGKTAADEVALLYGLLDAEGWNAVGLKRAVKVLNCPERTAARRLAQGRREYVAELGRRADQENSSAFEEHVRTAAFWLARDPGLSGTDIGKRLGTGDSYGRRVKRAAGTGAH